MKTEAETQQVKDAVLRDLDQQVCSGAQVDHPRLRETAGRYCDQFSRVMNGRRPYRSEEQACRSFAPLILWIFARASGMFARWVISRLWHHWNVNSQLRSRETTNAGTQPQGE